MQSKEDIKLKGRKGKPENGDTIIMWNYSDAPEIRQWSYNEGKLFPVARYVYDDAEPGEGQMVYLDSDDSQLEDEMGTPDFKDALKEYPYWDVEGAIYKVEASIEEYMNYDFNEKFAKVKFYSYYASYFVYNDASGMTDDEIKDCEVFEDALFNYLECDGISVVDVLDDSDFGDVEIPVGYRVKGYMGYTFLPGDVCTYVIQKS